MLFCSFFVRLFWALRMLFCSFFKVVLDTTDVVLLHSDVLSDY